MNGRADAATAAREPALLLALRVFALAALAFSSAAAVEYYVRSGAFCAPGSGCTAVRNSAIGRTLGTGLPALGVVGFAAVLLATLSRRARVRTFGLAFAVAGAIAGVVLLGLQAFVVGAFCALCVGVDVSAAAAGACAAPLLSRAPRLPNPTERARALWHACLLLAALAPPAWTASRATERPAFVQSLSTPGKISVVEFSDFECPFCRALHPVLKAALAPYGSGVDFIRKTYPLAGHAHSRDAARAYLCASAQGRGEDFADWLFAADDVSAERCGEHTVAIGLDARRFTACMLDPETARSVARDAAAIEAADFQGLPTVWIGKQRIVGFDRKASTAPYAAALERAEANRDGRPRIFPLAALFVLIMLALAPALRRR